MSWPWDELGLPGPSGLAAVKHAYAERLKAAHPEEDPRGFQQLHEAYRQASQLARRQEQQSDHGMAENVVLNGSLQRESRSRNSSRLMPEKKTEVASPQWEKPKKEQDWDYELLFSKGVDERLRARRQRALQRRQEQCEITTSPLMEKNLSVLELALQETALQELDAMEAASLREWEQFLCSSIFLGAQYIPDFIYGLEDYLCAYPPEPEIQALLFEVYGFGTQPPEQELQPLYSMLVDGWRGEQQKEDRRFLWWLFGISVLTLIAIGGFIVGYMLPFS